LTLSLYFTSIIFIFACKIKDALLLSNDQAILYGIFEDYADHRQKYYHTCHQLRVFAHFCASQQYLEAIMLLFSLLISFSEYRKTLNFGQLLKLPSKLE
jgi:hypothetical protein